MRSWKGYLVVAVGVGVVADLPGLLAGALSVEIIRELGFGTAAFGSAVAMTRGMGVVASVPAGLLTDRIGSIAALRISAVLALAAALSIALVADGWLVLAVSLAVAGLAIAIGQPAANRLIFLTVPGTRQGIAFGVKQSAPPTAALLAGLFVPAVALTWGWRAAFGTAGVLAAVMLLMIGRRPPRTAGPGRRDRARRGPGGRVSSSGIPLHRLLWLASGFALGSAAAVAIPTFYTATAVAAGVSWPVAGTMLAVASAATVLVRVVMGLVADRVSGGHLLLCGAMALVGTGGLALLSTGVPVLLGVGVVVGTAALWGFNGVFWFSVVRLAGSQPGAITGQLSTAGHLGGSLGPLAFGFAVEQVGFDTSWGAWTVLGLAAALSFWFAARGTRRDAADRPPV